MPGSVSLTGKDVVTINNRILHDYADGDFADLAFDEDLMRIKRSKDGNTIYALNENGNISTMKIRLLLGSSDDTFFNGLFAAMKADPAGFVLMLGSFTKRVGDGKGGTKLVIYQNTGGAFAKAPAAKSNAAGDTEASVVIWTLKFGDSNRAIM